MNDPKDQPIDIAEQRDWLNEHKTDTGLSWKALASRSGIARSTISLFAGNNYHAPSDKIAASVFRYRQTLAAQASLKGETVEIPTYFPTETSERLMFLLTWAQRGRIVLGALGPGLSKSITAQHFKACNANVSLMTISPSTSGIFNMQKEVLRSLGDRTTTGSTQVLSRAIKDRFDDLTKPLLILDEAQHLTVTSIEEIRHWHDETGVGIALFGNESIQQKLDGGNRAAAFAQIFSRVSLNVVRSYPLAGDVEPLLDAWRIRDEAISKEVHRLARMPGALRGVTFTLELAHMLAAADNSELQLSHVQDAWTQLSKRSVAA